MSEEKFVSEMISGEAPKTKEEVLSKISEQIVMSQMSARNCLGDLRHGQKTRLLEAMIDYPMHPHSFDEPEMRRAYAAFTSLHDATVALGVEIVVESIIHPPAEEGTELAAVSQAEAPKKRGRKKKEVTNEETQE